MSAVALRPQGAAAAIANKTFTQAIQPAIRFGRIFNLPPFAPATSQVRTALMDIGKPGGILDAKDDLSQGPVLLITDPSLSVNNPDNPTMTAGVHFLGQFIDHDMTFDLTSKLGVPAVPEQTPDQRTPVLDLDHVYGGGPSGSPRLYDPADPAKFTVESGGLFEDVPRQSDGTAIIADPRNDENMMVSGLHAAMLLFHNRVVDTVRQTTTANVFATARRLVTWHYQWIVVHEFLPENIGAAVVSDILANGLHFFKPDGGTYMPVEFSAACYRFGHSQIRPSYRANLAGDLGNPFFGFIFDPAAEGQADPSDLRGGARAPRRFIGWQTFFDFGGDQTQNVRRNKLIDTAISTPLFQLPLSAIATHDQPISLMQRDLLRQLTWSLPSGQLLAAHMGAPVLGASHFPELQSYGFASSTPLIYYVLREAQALNNGTHLGPVGGRIVGEVILGLLLADSGSYLRNNRAWKPTLPSRTPGDFTMVDLLTFAKVDPASRGQ